MSRVGERDYSSLETCHLLLQLPVFNASREFIVLSLDGSCIVEQNLHRLQNEQPATTSSILDHYIQWPYNAMFNDMTLINFARNTTAAASTANLQHWLDDVATMNGMGVQNFVHAKDGMSNSLSKQLLQELTAWEWDKVILWDTL